MGSSNSNEAEVSAAARRKKLNDDLDRIEKDKEAERQQRAEETERKRIAAENAKEAMEKQQKALKVSCAALVEAGSTGSGGRWMCTTQRRMATSQN